MSSSIQVLPLPRGKKHSWMTVPMTMLAALVIAAGVASFFALRDHEPASSSTAGYESSGPIIGTGPGLAQLENSGPIAGRGRALAEQARRLATYRESGLISGTGPAFSELRGVDVIRIDSAWVFASAAALENQFGRAAPNFASWPSVAALERGAIGTAFECSLVRPGPC